MSDKLKENPAVLTIPTTDNPAVAAANPNPATDHPNVPKDHPNLPKLDNQVTAFGHAITNVNCERTSFLLGAAAGSTLGVGHYLTYRDSMKARNLTFGSILAITLANWIYCRYKLSRARLD